MSSSFHTEVFLVDFTIFFGESQTFTTNQKVKIRRKYHCTVTVMSKYHKMDTNKYPNIFGFHIMNRTNIQYIWMPYIYRTSIRIYSCSERGNKKKIGKKEEAMSPYLDASKNKNIGATICISRQILCLPYAFFFYNLLNIHEHMNHIVSDLRLMCYVQCHMSCL